MTKYLVLQKRHDSETCRPYDNQPHDYCTAFVLADYLNAMDVLGYYYIITQIVTDETPTFTDE